MIGLAGWTVGWSRDFPQAHVSDRFFESDDIPYFQITIPESGMRSLKGQVRAYTPCTIQIDSTTYSDVGIHLKGGAGSFQQIDQKPSFTLNFDKYVGGQKFHGLDKIHLNNCLQDPTYLKEWICSQLFLAAGVPTARTAHARVNLNGRDLGLYALKEGYEKTFLKRHFPDAGGNLYDGGLMMDIDQPLEMDSGKDPHDRSDLARLAHACQEIDPEKRLVALQSVLDWDRFVSFLAMEVMTWHWDGYGMKANNYRLYHDPTSDRFVFFAHGMDQMFWDAQGPLVPPMRGQVARAVVSIPQGRQALLDRVRQLSQSLFVIETLRARIERRGRRLGEVLGAINAEMVGAHAGHVQNLIELVEIRARFLRDPMNASQTNSQKNSPWLWERVNQAMESSLDIKPVLAGSTPAHHP